MKKNFKFLIILFLTILISPSYGFLQTLSEDYDKRDMVIDPFEKEDKEVYDKHIKEIISRIARGDSTVLRLIVFETLEKVHDQIVKEERSTGRSYFDILGSEAALPAIVGGFDNQDPKVRLKSIGYLGHWVEEIGKNLAYIESVVDNRMNSNIETRKEVRYAYRILKMKITRKKVIESLKEGDQRVLVQISPEEFLPLVYYEPRIRTIYLGSSAAVKIRSIVLDEGVQPETGQLMGNIKGRHPGLDIESICYQGVKSYNYQSEVSQWMNSNEGKNTSNLSNRNDMNSGTKNYAKNQPIQNRSNLDWDCVSAIYVGIDNKSQLVREHSARIFLNYIRGYTGDRNYSGSIKTNPRVFSQDLYKLSRTASFVRIAQVAWDNVKWSEFYYNDRVSSITDTADFIKNRFYMEYQYGSGAESTSGGDYKPANTERYFSKDATSYAEWGTEITGNYRNDIKEILRVLGQSYYLDPEYVPKETVSQYYQSRVSTLFNDSNRTGRQNEPDSGDVLEGEQSPVYNTQNQMQQQEQSNEQEKEMTFSSPSSTTDSLDESMMEPQEEN